MILCIHGIDITHSTVDDPSMNYLFARDFLFSFEVETCKFVCAVRVSQPLTKWYARYIFIAPFGMISGQHTRCSNRQTSPNTCWYRAGWRFYELCCCCCHCVFSSLRVNQEWKKKTYANLWHFMAQFNCCAAFYLKVNRAIYFMKPKGLAQHHVCSTPRIPSRRVWRESYQNHSKKISADRRPIRLKFGCDNNTFRWTEKCRTEVLT